MELHDWATRSHATHRLATLTGEWATPVALVLLCWACVAYVRTTAWQRALPRLAVNPAALMLLAYAVSRVFQACVIVQRPFVRLELPPLLEHVADSSMPSDHALIAFAAACSVLSIRPKWFVVLLVASAASAAGRVACLLHWPSDIAGAGLLVTALTLTLGRLQQYNEPNSTGRLPEHSSIRMGSLAFAQR